MADVDQLGQASVRRSAAMHHFLSGRCVCVIDSMMGWIKHGIEKMVPQPDAHVHAKVEKTADPLQGVVCITSPWQPPVVDAKAVIGFQQQLRRRQSFLQPFQPSETSSHQRSVVRNVCERCAAPVTTPLSLQVV